MSRSTPITLQSHYYLDHFQEMTRFVEERYQQIFESEHVRFLSDFRELDRNAQSLYVRIANRKGHVLPRVSIRYPEIDSIEEAITTLYASRFLRPLTEEDFPRLLALQTKEVLVRLVRSHSDGDSLPSSSARKRDWIAYALTNLEWERCFPNTVQSDYLVQDRTEELAYFLFLYFGRISPNLQSFTLRDLGLIRTNKETSQFLSRFDDRETALSAFHYTRLLENLPDLSLDGVLALSADARDWLESEDPEVETLRHQLIRNVGRTLERIDEPKKALDVYSLSDRFPATERAVRLLYQADEKEAVEKRLITMIDEPSCDEELFFAEDFYRRKFQQERVGRLTGLLRDANLLSLDESGRGNPERTAALYLARDGSEAHHVENAIWSQLFTLLFWDLLYGPHATNLHSSFDRTPSGLNSGQFYARHQSEIEQRLSLLDKRDATQTILRRSLEAAMDAPATMGSLSPELFVLTERLVASAPPGALAAMLKPMTQNHREARRGFPDLIVFRNEGVSFVEIKTEGDQIRRHQLVQIERLLAAGFPVEVMRVQWTVDPEQEYVVVDVETTGGKAEWNRITEIGAVKVRGGKLIDEWSTLVNPQRRIPRKIVELTGITDEMVATAPPFAAVADDFREFLGEAVFAAHRATFDYGFIREEFRRIEEPFSCPTLCTCAAMRRCFPGLPSYGLAKLCAEFNVPLESHHRALEDARATAHLLLRINARRLEIAERETQS